MLPSPLVGPKEDYRALLSVKALHSPRKLLHSHGFRKASTRAQESGGRGQFGLYTMVAPGLFRVLGVWCMNNRWLEKKHNELATDLFRNFCLIHLDLEKEFTYFHETGEIRFKPLHEILGQEMAQGRLWLLKDTAHLLFRKQPETPLSGIFLDWSIAYIFHECMKLREDAYQLQTYIPWFQFVQSDPKYSRQEQEVGSNLFRLASQTRESINKEVHRIEFILDECKNILIRYLPHHRRNPVLARFLFEHEKRVRDVFQDLYQDLLWAIYGDAPETQYLLAAQHLLQSAWLKKAQTALERAAKINPEHNELQTLRNRIAHSENKK